MAQHIVVTAHSAAWARMFEEEAEAIRRILGENCAAVHHIGSTAVPGLPAKPIIDIMPVVWDIGQVDGVRRPAMNIWGNSASPAGGICARAGICAPTSSTSLPIPAGTMWSGIWRCGTTCAPTRKPPANTGR